MTPTCTTAPTAGSLEEALEALHQRLPEMDAAAAAFASLRRAAEEMDLRDASWPPPLAFDAEAFNAGTPLLAGGITRELGELFLESATVMLSAIQKSFPGAAQFAVDLGGALENGAVSASECVKAALSGDEGALDGVAERAGIPVQAANFLLQEILRPCLRHASAVLGKWAGNELWFKSVCPVCGSRPDMGHLKEKEDCSEFLVSKAGVMWLHCSLCGHDWRFMRLVCPSCGQQDHEQLEVLSSEDRPEERVHACKACKSYLPVMDLTKWRGPFDADLAPLGLVHMDILAQEKGYAPLVQRPWNTFGKAED